HGGRLAVGGQCDLVGLHRGHYATSSWTVFLKGQPFSEMCSWNSSRKYLMTLRGNQVEASPSGQKDRPSMLYPMSSSRSMSPGLASPASKRSKRFAIQKVPSRHGVHLPQLSWWKNLTYRRAASTMQVVSSITTMAPAPASEPAFAIASKSRPTSRCSGSRTIIEAPPGWKAFNLRFFQTPPPCPSISSRIGVPFSISYAVFCLKKQTNPPH